MLLICLSAVCGSASQPLPPPKWTPRWEVGSPFTQVHRARRAACQTVEHAMPAITYLNLWCPLPGRVQREEEKRRERETKETHTTHTNLRPGTKIDRFHFFFSSSSSSSCSSLPNSCNETDANRSLIPFLSTALDLPFFHTSLDALPYLILRTSFFFFFLL